jgi:hypothetical protein
MLALECHAYLGDLASIEAELRMHAEFIFPEYFIRYICQVVIENTSAPDAAIEPVSRILQSTVGLAQPGPGAFQMFNRHSCQLAVQFMEQLRDASLAEAALEQMGATGDPYEDLENSLQFKRIKFALALDGDLITRLSQVDGEKAYQEIVKRLMNHGSPDRVEYFQALATMWRIGEQWSFLDNVLLALDKLAADSSTEARQALVWAYQKARFLDRDGDAQRIRLKLVDIPAIDETLLGVDAASATDRLEQALSPMARLALRSANWDLAQATKDSMPWKDAGMISLGFFRIIELELNERLIIPALQHLDMRQLEATLHDLKTGEPGKSVKDAIGVWERLLPQLRRAKEEQRGLELGALEMLLGKTAKLTGPDVRLKSAIQTEILKRLSADGVEAFQSGKLARLIDSEAREKFRNPPAHSRYLALPVARECKHYVDNILEQIIAFTVGNPETAETVH